MYKGYLIATVLFYTVGTIIGVLTHWVELPTTTWEPESIFLTFTYWNFLLQGFFYIMELLSEYKCINLSKNTKEIALNIIFAPGVSVLAYWVIINSLNWGFLIPWYVDVSIHGINILMLMGIVVVKYPCIAQLSTLQNILLPVIVPLLYCIVAVTYTSVTMRLIYPSNLFSFVTVEDSHPYGWVGVIYLCVGIPLPQVVFYFICKALKK